MKTIPAYLTILVLGLLLSSGCRTTINAFEGEDFFNTRPGDMIVRGTNHVYEITEEGRWCSRDMIERAMRARLKK